MCVVLIRSLLLYLLVIFAVRLMGKRQLGELQPSELVITILVSNIATLPLEDVDIPIVVGVTPIFALVCYEVIVSWVSLKSQRLRKLMSGSPKIIIKDGKIDPQVMKDLRFSVDDLMMSLRGKDIFDLSEVQYAIVETTGSLSVMTNETTDCDPPQVVVSDGKIVAPALKNLGLNESKIGRVLKKASAKLSEVLIMTADTEGNFYIADKSGAKPVIINNYKF